MKVFILNPFEEATLGVLRAHLVPGVDLSFGPDLPTQPDYQVLVAGRPQRLHIVASPSLRALVIPFAGIPDVTRELLLEFPALAIYNLHHNAVPAAETALALLLAAAKFLVPFDRDFRINDWTRRYQPNPSILLAGKTALVIGYGQIGQRLGIYLQALGLRVLAVRRRLDAPRLDGAPDIVYPPQALPDLLPQAQILIITLPLTDQTRGLIGAFELARLPRGSLLVNVGRGPLVDQAALYRALRDGHLAAAGLDVWYNYPDSIEARRNTSPADYPFHELENVVISPHRAGASLDSEALRAVHLAELLNALARGGFVPNQVDLRVGY